MTAACRHRRSGGGTPSLTHEVGEEGRCHAQRFDRRRPPIRPIRGNYADADRPASNPIDKIVVHVTPETYSETIDIFQDPGFNVSAHYIVRSSDGAVAQAIQEEDIAYHAGNYAYNRNSIGIEHEGFVDDPSWFTDAMYRSSARLAAYLVAKYSIPIDRNHIVGHSEIPGATHVPRVVLELGQVPLPRPPVRQRAHRGLRRRFGASCGPSATSPRTAGRTRAWVARSSPRPTRSSPRTGAGTYSLGERTTGSSTGGTTRAGDTRPSRDRSCLPRPRQYPRSPASCTFSHVALATSSATGCRPATAGSVRNSPARHIGPCRRPVPTVGHIARLRPQRRQPARPLAVDGERLVP